MERHNLTAGIRVEKGKQAAKRLRNEKRIPATLYGQGNEPVMLSVNSSDLNKIMKATKGENIILNLQIESGKGTDNRMVMLKELQVDAIKDTFIHADFLGISMDKEITLDIPIRLINTPKGAVDGGMLQQARREISIACLPANVIEQIDVDVSGLDIGDSIHIGDIVLPEGVRSTIENDLAVAMVLAPSASKEDREEGEEEKEPASKKDAEEEKSA